MALPTGMVAFLMSDIEGSTRLISLVGDAFGTLLDDHHALMRQAVEGRDGVVVSAEGDSVFAVFPSARLAIEAAIGAQRALSTHSWPGTAQVRVRIGIHAGEAVFRSGTYTGLDVHRTARIMDAAWGGQILVSDAVRALTPETLQDGVALRDLGLHQLRDMPARERLHQVVAPGLLPEFPALRLEEGMAASTLPAPLDRLIGREDEVAAVSALLAEHRLVTLTGPGGSGKTRLSIEVARHAHDEFPAGAWFVAVEAVRNPRLVIPTVAQALGVPEQGGRAIGDVLAERLRDRRALIVLDNLEQVIEAAPDIARLLGQTTSVAILATSRERLAVAGEQSFQVLPLSLPADGAQVSAADVQGAAAIQLFVDRARAVLARFELTDANAATIAAICQRLDGLPLAIELAAARVNVLGLEELLERLNRSLSVLAAARRDLPNRQRTLRAAIGWSHDLLSEAEQKLFRRCAVFVGGMDIEALEAVADADRSLGSPVVDLVGALADRSLVRSFHERATGTSRLSMLETIREFATEQLEAAGESAELQAGHAAHYASVAEAAAGVMVDPRRDEILDRLDGDLGNLRTAIAWSLASGETVIGLRLAAALNDFWHLRNHITEGVRVLEELVTASAADGDASLRARATLVAGSLLTWLGDPERSLALSLEGTAMAERLRDKQNVAFGKSAVGWSMFYTHADGAFDVFVEGAEAARQAGEVALEMECLMGQAWTHLLLGRPEAASARANDVIGIADRIGVPYIAAFAEVTLGIVAGESGDRPAALRHYRAALRLAHGSGGHVGTSLALEAVGWAAVEDGRPELGVRLAAAAERLREEIRGNVSLAELRREPPLARARRLMPEEAFEAARQQGRALTVDEAVALALEEAG